MTKKNSMTNKRAQFKNAILVGKYPISVVAAVMHIYDTAVASHEEHIRNLKAENNKLRGEIAALKKKKGK